MSIVVRNVGPVGGPGMPEMVMLTIQLQGRGLGEDVALITDGRFSGVSHGILIGHISPEAARGGPIAAVRDGDTIVIDPGTRTAQPRSVRRGDRPAHGRLAPARRRGPPAPRLRARQVRQAGLVSALRLRRLTKDFDGAYDAAAANLARLRISGWMRWPNCSMPMMKSSKVSITPREPVDLGHLVEQARDRGVGADQA